MVRIEYSPKDKNKWLDALLNNIESQISSNNLRNEDLIKDILSLRVSLHLGVFVEPYLQLILDRKKTLESRFSVNKVSPYRQVFKDDILLLKRSGGPIIGICQIDESWSYVLNPDLWEEIKETHHKALCIQGPDFWIQKRKSNYATLMKLKNIELLDSPINFVKSDRRGWINLLPRDHKQTIKLF
ncbi:hypothetical protein GO755_37060 [Spirosoma sp. HMF4905]|uniref:Uncharacterized protein n=1 Tax=Spirosoma arboris TaxID=2682092 RepID=A0A7K1SPE0_9BACT|nr:hypothetical protein [Spirosoma arboris]MVM35684.1 hypothetical protein [Spirosoma arboris]